MATLKRRAAVVDSDDDNDNQSRGSSPAPKRARTTDGESDLEPATSPRPKREKKGKEKARHDNGEDDEEEVDEAEIEVEKPEEDDEVEEQKFEEQHGAAIRASIEAKRNLHGGIADHGIIEAIEMHQFMCHKYLTFQFGPQINFIIGHNGSGKSAVLSAISVALGGKSGSTGRGLGLKAFIREGQSVAEVTIQIKNQGEEAFKPTEYGESIIVTRRFTKEGSTTWKIKSKDGKVISNKREELSAICDHMNIQVDNPMNVLTQDSARQFLSASHPADKYQFFLKGTQLSQLTDEYDTCLDNIAQTTKVLQQKKEAIPDLKSTLKEATTRFQEADKARTQKKKAEELKKELAWAHVKKKELEMQKKFEEIAKLERRLPRIKDNVASAERAFEEASTEVARHEAEHRALGDIDHLTATKTDLNNKIRENKNQLTIFKADERRMDTSLKSMRGVIAGYEKRIADETAKMEAHSQGKREEITRKLEHAKQNVAAEEENLSDVCEQRRQRTAELDTLTANANSVHARAERLKQDIQHAEHRLGGFMQQEKDDLAPYGSDIKGVLAEISKMKWHGEVLGPLGMHVRVKDPKWAPILRMQLGRHMFSFNITDSRDQSQLKALFRRTRNDHISIVITQKELFDYNHGEPPADVLTVLRALEFTDQFVIRILINLANIESILLALERADAERLLRSVRGGVCWTGKDFFRVMVYKDGGGASNPLQAVPIQDKRQLLFSGRDVASEIQHWRNEKGSLELQYQKALREETGHKPAWVAVRKAITDLEKLEKEVNVRLRQARSSRDGFQEEANNDVPIEVASIEEAKAESEKELESIKDQFAAATKKRMDVDELQVPLLRQLNEIRDQINDFEERRVAIRNHAEEAVQQRLVAQNSKKHYADKLKKEEEEVEKVQGVAQDLQHEFADWTSKAEEFCTRYENPRSADVVERNLASVTNALKEREKRHGATVEEMTIEVNKAQSALDTVTKDLKNMSTLNKALKSSLIIRLAKWQEFRRHIALRCKLVFSYHLSNRGYYGKVLFDHKNGRLELKVKTDDQTLTQGGDKDPRSLSGGEKSFSTICLLLSLWESIGCPLRCLDEFDVFMDAVNRRISMKMMIDTANASNKKQYILITPQDMNNVQIGNTVRVHRMTDPERGQGVLAF